MGRGARRAARRPHVPGLPLPGLRPRLRRPLRAALRLRGPGPPLHHCARESAVHVAQRYS
eukprot:264202-Alexandrium_andersonii.AAC.1